MHAFNYIISLTEAYFMSVFMCKHWYMIAGGVRNDATSLWKYYFVCYFIIFSFSVKNHNYFRKGFET